MEYLDQTQTPHTNAYDALVQSSMAIFRSSVSPSEPKWYAASTRSNHEKTVASQLVARGVEHFLPTYTSVRRWKDRRVTLQLPLFPGYIFVHMALADRMAVVTVPGVARLVGFDGTPVALPEQEITTLRTSLAKGFQAAPHPYLVVGRRVRVKSGALAGLSGILMRHKGNFRVVVSIDLLRQAAAVEVPCEDLEIHPEC
jgi:transcription antitermination factor NusG